MNVTRTLYLYTAIIPTTVSETHKLVSSYKKMILGASGFYLAIGGSIYLVISVTKNPDLLWKALLSLAASLYFITGPMYTNGAYLLITFLSLVIMMKFPFILAGNTKVRQVTIPVREGMDDLVDYITGIEETGSVKPEEKPVQSGNPGIMNGSKGMLMVADGKVMFVNKDFCQLTGYSPAEVIGRDFVDLLPTSELPKYATLVRAARNNETPAVQGIHILTPGNRSYVLTIAANKGAGVNPNDLCLFYLRETEETSKVQQTTDDIFIRSVETSRSCIWMWDSQGLIYVNSNCKKYIHVPMSMLMRNPGFLLKVFKGTERKEMSDLFGKYYDTLHFNEEISFTDQDGELHWFQVGMYPCRDHIGIITHHIGIANEITEQKLKLAELEEKYESAVNANFNKTAFLANMSHEIRSPLNGILGFSELLVDPELSPADRDRYHEIIKNNGNVLLTILSDIIDISKLESGKMKIMERGFLPANLLKELQFQFGKDPMVLQKKLVLNWFENEDQTDVQLFSDPFRVRQVLVNLINNALKYSERGEIEIATEWWGDRAVFWVKDTGIGIPEESQPYIFDRYRQVARTDSNNSTGFGLGLAICKALVELLGGNIWVESEAGHGSVFYFTIPNKTPNPIEMNNLNPNETAFPYDWKGRTILIAEDIDFSFLYIEAVLRRTGAKVLWAQNGREAIEMVKVNPGIDIALMDIHMPIMNGYDATREIIKIRPDLPVIAQTAFVLPDDVKACYAAGCAGYLAKPIRREQLLNTLTEYFEKIDQNAAMQAGDMPVYRSKIS